MVPFLAVLALSAAPPPTPSEARPARTEAELRFWLENMLWHHRYSDAEAGGVLGLSIDEVGRAARKLDIRPDNRPRRAPGAVVKLLPYPGGRHPRIGFLEGAIRPQRETKVSVFAPWDEDSYVVIDVPEAIWSNLGLTYLAHTHVPTLWTRAGVTLPRLEWQRRADGSLFVARRLPNGIAFTAHVVPRARGVAMELTLTNGTKEKLTDLRVQNCVLLARAKSFEAQSSTNKVHRSPYSACRSADGKRWIIAAWSPVHRTWDNPRCPCLHSDPRFPDCPPGETRTVRGALWFHEGTDLDDERRRLDKSGWERGAEKR